MQIRVLEHLDLRKYIEVRLFGERPHIRGRRIPVATLAHSARTQGWSVADLVHEFTLTEAEVLAALLYYAEHQAILEAQEAVYQTQLDSAYHDA